MAQIQVDERASSLLSQVCQQLQLPPEEYELCKVRSNGGIPFVILQHWWFVFASLSCLCLFVFCFFFDQVWSIHTSYHMYQFQYHFNLVIRITCSRFFPWDSSTYDRFWGRLSVTWNSMHVYILTRCQAYSKGQKSFNSALASAMTDLLVQVYFHVGKLHSIKVRNYTLCKNFPYTNWPCIPSWF